MEFKKETQMLLKDYIAFNIYFAKKKLLLNAIIFFLIFSILALIISYFGIIKWTYSLVFGIAGVVLMTLTNISSIKKVSSKQYESSKAMQKPSTTIINNSKVGETSEFGSIFYEWNDMYCIEKSKSTYYLFFSRIQAFIIPKRLLTQEEENTLRQLINENLEDKKNKLKKR